MSTNKDGSIIRRGLSKKPNALNGWMDCVPSFRHLFVLDTRPEHGSPFTTRTQVNQELRILGTKSS